MSDVFDDAVMSVINRTDLLQTEKVESKSSETVYCEVNNETREINIPEDVSIFGVEHDENAARILFICPKIIGTNMDIDIAQCSVRIVYKNAQGIKDQYIVEDLTETEDGENVTFSWVISRTATAYKGIIEFGIRAVKTKSDGTGIIVNEWNTTVANANVLVGVESSEILLSEDNVDVINQLLEMTKQTIEDEKNKAVEEIQSMIGLALVEEHVIIIK